MNKEEMLFLRLESLQWQESPRPGSVAFNQLSSRPGRSESKDFIRQNIRRIRTTGRMNGLVSARNVPQSVFNTGTSNSTRTGLKYQVNADPISALSMTKRTPPFHLLNSTSGTGVSVSDEKPALLTSLADRTGGQTSCHELCEALTAEKASQTSFTSPVRSKSKAVEETNLPTLSLTASTRNAGHSAVDFVRANVQTAALTAPRRCRSSNTLTGSTPSHPKVAGKLPAYLLRRLREKALMEARIRSNEPDPEQPPGHRKMSENERIETLHLLHQAHSELFEDLNRLPISLDTLKLRERKSTIENQLSELEMAISVFKKPKVFVRQD